LRRLVLVAWSAGCLAWAQHSTGGEEGGARQFDPTLWKFANFALLAGAIAFVIAKNAGPFFASRSHEIRRGIEEAQAMRAEAEARAAQMERRLEGLGTEIEALRRGAREEAAAEGERMRAETQRELVKLQAQAEQEIASAAKAAQAELRQHAAQLALGLARRKVRERITPADHDALIGDFAAGLRTLR